MVEYSESMMRAGAQEEAHAGFVQASQLDPKNERAWIGCARTTTDVAQALGFVGRALEINPQNQEGLELRDWLRKLESDMKSPSRKKRPVMLDLAILTLVLLLVVLVVLFVSQYLVKG